MFLGSDPRIVQRAAPIAWMRCVCGVQHVAGMPDDALKDRPTRRGQGRCYLRAAVGLTIAAFGEAQPSPGRQLSAPG